MGSPGDYGILVIEDDEISRELLVEHLSEYGFRVTSVEDGLRGFIAMKEDPPSLVLLDIMMPRVDGYTFLKKMKDQIGGSKPPIVIVSSLGSIENVKKAIALGATDYITKPINLNRLNEKISKLLNVDIPVLDISLMIDIELIEDIYIVKLSGTLNEKETPKIKERISDAVKKNPDIKQKKFIIDLIDVDESSFDNSMISSIFDFYAAIDGVEPTNLKILIDNDIVIEKLDNHSIAKFFDTVRSKNEALDQLKTK